MEIRDDSKETFDESIGLSVYSTSKAGVISYVSIFENLWSQTELYERLKLHANAARIYQYCKPRNKNTYPSCFGILSLIQGLKRNADRLQRLSNGILDVTRIESQTLFKEDKMQNEDINLGETNNGIF